jgi:hypothetical protein
MKVTVNVKYRIITKTFINSGGALSESFEIESDNNSLFAHLAIYSKMYNECAGYPYSKAYDIRLKAYEETKLTLLSDMQKRLSPDNPEINGFIFEHLADGDDDAPITKKDSSELSAMVLGEFLSNEERLHYGALLLLNGRFGFEKVESNNEGLFDSVKQLNQYKALIKRIAEKKGVVKMYNVMQQGNDAELPVQKGKGGNAQRTKHKVGLAKRLIHELFKKYPDKSGGEICCLLETTSYQLQGWRVERNIGSRLEPDNPKKDKYLIVCDDGSDGVTAGTIDTWLSKHRNLKSIN